MARYCEIFLTKLPQTHADDLSESADLESVLEQLLETAREAWPNISVSDEDFLHHLALCLARSAESAKALSRLRVGHLYLACAFSLGSGDAVTQLRAFCLPVVRSALSRIGLGELVEETMQQIFAELLAGEPPMICTYSGLGDLRTWVKVIAVRTASRTIKKQRREMPTDDAVLLGRVSEQVDSELAQFKIRYRETFKAAFQRSFVRLSARDRNVLRLELLDGLNIDQIGELHNVHRATVARWRADARTRLFDGTLAELTRERKLSGTEFRSVFRLIQSQLDVSLTRLLAGKKKAKTDRDEQS